MKHKKIVLVLWAFAVLTRLSAQNKELLGYLPGDAKVVVHVNLGKLSQKLSWQEITQMDFFQELMHKAGATAENFITHPAETGLDFSAGLYLAATINTPSEEDENAGKGNYVVILGKMGDEKTFASLVKKNAGKKTTITTAGANNFILDKEASLAWNKSVFLLHIQTGNKKQKSGNRLSRVARRVSDDRHGAPATDRERRRARRMDLRARRPRDAVVRSAPAPRAEAAAEHHPRRHRSPPVERRGPPPEASSRAARTPRGAHRGGEAGRRPPHVGQPPGQRRQPDPRCRQDRRKRDRGT